METGGKLGEDGGRERRDWLQTQKRLEQEAERETLFPVLPSSSLLHPSAETGSHSFVS